MRAPKRLARTGAGTAHGMASLATAFAAGAPSPAPDEGRWCRVPSLRGGFQSRDDLVPRPGLPPWGPALVGSARQRLGGVAALLEAAVHRLGHIEPEAAQRGVARQDAMVEQPTHEARALVPGESIQI